MPHIFLCLLLVLQTFFVTDRKIGLMSKLSTSRTHRPLLTGSAVQLNLQSLSCIRKTLLSFATLSGPPSYSTTSVLSASHGKRTSSQGGGGGKPNNLSQGKFGATTVEATSLPESCVIGLRERRTGKGVGAGHCCWREQPKACNQMSTGIKLKYRKNINQKMTGISYPNDSSYFGCFRGARGGAWHQQLSTDGLNGFPTTHTRISHIPWPWLRELVARLCSLDMRDEWITFSRKPCGNGSRTGMKNWNNIYNYYVRGNYILGSGVLNTCFAIWWLQIVVALSQVENEDIMIKISDYFKYVLTAKYLQFWKICKKDKFKWKETDSEYKVSKSLLILVVFDGNLTMLNLV